MNTGTWVVGKAYENGKLKWTEPGKVLMANDQVVIFEIPYYYGEKIECHRMPQDIRPATMEDFDQVILNASKLAVGIEEFVSNMYDIQKTL